ncbi:hypothetical protein T484DRAFT_1612116, partial [Baffinella frigidus]
NSEPHTLNPTPQTPNPKPQTPNPTPQTPNPKPQTPNPKPQTPNPKPQTLNPKHETLIQASQSPARTPGGYSRGGPRSAVHPRPLYPTPYPVCACAASSRQNVNFDICGLGRPWTVNFRRITSLSGSLSLTN